MIAPDNFHFGSYIEEVSMLQDNKKLRERIIKSSLHVNDQYEYNMDDDLEIDLKEFLEDKQVEVGYDEKYNPNKKWENIQQLIDLIDNQ